MRRFVRYAVTSVAPVALFVCCRVAAQLPSEDSARHPAADDPDLFAVFFSSYGERIREMAEAKRPELIADNAAFRATFLHVRAADLPKADSIIQALIQETDRLGHLVRQHVSDAAAKKQLGDRNTLLELELRRLQTLTAAIQELKRTLSPESWESLRSYVNGPFRLNIRQIPNHAATEAPQGGATEVKQHDQ
jgi:hypothetical protein